MRHVNIWREIFHTIIQMMFFYKHIIINLTYKTL